MNKPYVAGTMTLLPPARDKCQVCAVNHEQHLPHNQQSLYYQTAFNMKHDRAPTWADAMEHCDDNTKRFWTEELLKMGVKI